MRNILITILLFIPTLVFATPRQQLDDGNGNILGTSGNPVHVNCVSGCGSGTGTGGGTPGGANTNVQYNSSGSFAGNSGFVYDGTNVGVGNNLNAISSVNIGTTGLGVLTVRRDSAANATNELITLRNANISNNNGTTIAFQDNGSNNNQTTSYIAGIGPQHGTTPSGELAFGVSNFSATANEAMRIYHDGSIGIGTFSPTKKLSVLGNAGIGSTNYAALSASVNNGLVVEGNTGIGTYLPDLQMTVKGDSNFIGNLGIGTNQVTTSALTVMNGNVGIGTWIPTQKLDVKGTVQMTGFSLNQNPSSGYVLVSNPVGIGTWMPISSLGASIPGGSSGQLQINNSGAFAGVSGSSVDPVAGTVQINSLYTTSGMQNDNNYQFNSVPAFIYFNGGTDTFISADGSGIYLNSLDASLAKLSILNDNGGFLFEGGGPLVLNSGGGSPVFQASPNGDLTLGDPGASATGGPSFAMGVSINLGAGILASGQSSFAGGYSDSSSGIISATNKGSFAFGSSRSIGDTGGGAITASGQGSIASGYSTYNASNSTNGSIVASGTGSIAMGRGDGGILSASNSGAIALGFANQGALTASGAGSIAIGENVTATATNAVSIGKSVANPTATTMRLGFATTPTLTLDSANVGIGTVNISNNKLTVIGALNISSSNPYVTTVAPSNGALIQGNVGIGTFSISTQTARLSVMGGNMGIGTITPFTALSIIGGNVGIGTITATNGVLITNGGNVGLGTFNPQNQLSIGGNAAIGSAYSTISASSNGLIIQGNLGVGSSSPGQLLDVQGTIRISKIGATFSLASGSNACRGQSTLSTGTVTVNTTCTPSSSDSIFITDAGSGILANIGSLSVGVVTGGTSFVLNSSNALDSSNVNWIIINKT